MSQERTNQGISRRGFLKTTAIAAGAAALGGSTVSALAATTPTASTEVKKYNGVCRSNCNFGCRYWANVVDGKIIKLEVGDYDDPDYTGCCLKGISYIERIYHPDRLKYPLRRKEGTERGAGEWERISWDEAFKEVTTKLKDIAAKYGGKSIIYDRCTGNYSCLNGSTYGLYNRLGSLEGWCKPFINYDYGTGHGLDRIFGTGEWYFVNEIRSVYDARVAVMWGTNPVLTAPQAWRFIQKAHENGTKLISLDVIKSATAYKCDEWICTTPGNDALLALAMCNWLIEEDLIDHEYLKERSTQSFLVRSDTKKLLRLSNYSEIGGTDEATGTIGEGTSYIPAANAGGTGMTEVDTKLQEFFVWDLDQNRAVTFPEATNPAVEGTFVTENGIEVTTEFTLLKNQLKQYTLEWAERVCKVPAETIKKLARTYATEGPVSTYITYGSTDHYVYGHLAGYAVGMLHLLTGNYAKPGAGFLGVWSKSFPYDLAKIWVAAGFKGMDATLAQGKIWEVIESGNLEGNPYPLHAMFSAGSNMLSNMGAQNNMLDHTVKKLDFWVVVDWNMNDSAAHADIVLPCASWYEVDDMYSPYCHPYTVIQEKAIEPLYESKSDVEIAETMGRMMGWGDAFPEGRTPKDWMALALDCDVARKWNLTVENLYKNKYMRSDSAPNHAYVRGIDDAVATESGKFQLYWETPKPRVNYGQALPSYEKEHLPRYEPGVECAEDSPYAAQYPLVFLQEHSRFRVHSQWWDVPALREIDPEPLAKLNRIEADKRGIKDGDIVEVFSHRGHCVCKCLIDNSIAPGIISIPKGWQRSQTIAGGFQELTNGQMDPFPSVIGFYDARCDVRKYEGSVN